jgi:hypothetical protein
MTRHRFGEAAGTEEWKPSDQDGEARHSLLSSVIFALGLFLTVAGVGMLSAAVAAYVWSMLSS